VVSTSRRRWTAVQVVDSFVKGWAPVHIAIAAYAPDGGWRGGGLAWCAGEEGQRALDAVHRAIRSELRKALRDGSRKGR
jgi:hypothetical protein